MIHLPKLISTTLLILFIGSLGTQAQKRAEQFLEQNRFQEAADAYASYLKRHSDDSKGYEKMGDIQRNLRQFKEAEMSYSRCDALDGLSKKGRVNYGQMLFSNGKKTLAKEQFNKYLEMDPESFVVRMMYNSLSEVTAWENAPKFYTINRIEGPNSKFAEFSPIPYQGGLVFATERNIDHVNENESSWTGLPYLGIYHAEFEDAYALSVKRPKKFLTRLSANRNIGPITIDTVNQQVFLSMDQDAEKTGEIGKLGVFVADITNGKRLGKPVPMSFNSKDYSVTHPSITPDGSTLFFASNMIGTIVGMDKCSLLNERSLEVGPNLNES